MISLHGSIICASDGAKGTESTMAINTIIVIFTIVCISKDAIYESKELKNPYFSSLNLLVAWVNCYSRVPAKFITFIPFGVGTWSSLRDQILNT